MICRNCGTTIADKAIVCFRCGTPTDIPAPVRKRAPVSRSPWWLRLVLALILILGFSFFPAFQTTGAGEWVKFVTIVVVSVLLTEAILWGFRRRPPSNRSGPV
jgi:hypothetical protein